MDADRLLAWGVLAALALPVAGASWWWGRSYRRRRVQRRAQAAAFAGSLGWAWNVVGPRQLVRMGGARGALRCDMAEDVVYRSHGHSRAWTRWTTRGPRVPPGGWRIEVRPAGVVSGTGLLLTRVPSGDADLDERFAFYTSSPDAARALLADEAVRRVIGGLAWAPVRTGRLVRGEDAARLLRLSADGDTVEVEEPGVGHDEARWRRALELLDALAAASR